MICVKIKGMATYSSILAWRIPWMEEPGGLQFRRSQRIRHDWATSTRYKGMYGLPTWCSGKEPTSQYRRHERHGFDPWVRKIPWSRIWQPTPVFLPGESHGLRSLTGYNLWGHKESDTTEHTHYVYLTKLCIRVMETCVRWSLIFPGEIKLSRQSDVWGGL